MNRQEEISALIADRREVTRLHTWWCALLSALVLATIALSTVAIVDVKTGSPRVDRAVALVVERAPAATGAHEGPVGVQRAVDRQPLPHLLNRLDQEPPRDADAHKTSRDDV